MLEEKEYATRGHRLMLEEKEYATTRPRRNARREGIHNRGRVMLEEKECNQRPQHAEEKEYTTEAMV